MATDTKTVILDAAETLFANNGFAATSTRSVVAVAGVNLAAVNYHFGSKEGLIEAVLARRIGPLNEERFRLLEAYKEAAGKAGPTLERVLEALIGPALRQSRDPSRGGDVFVRLLGRAYMEPDRDWRKMVDQLFGETQQRFTAAFHASVPKLPDEDLYWRFHFMIGAMAHTMADTKSVRSFSKGACDPDDVDGIVTRLVTFLAAGMRAPRRRGRPAKRSDSQ